MVTKANSRSTVHRPAYLDYVGVKSFDEAGNVVGERRFLGLFTSAAYNESVHRHPGAAPQGRGGAGAQRVRADSHSGKDLLAILETYPRDELFQVVDRRPARPSRSRCCTCRSAASCGCSCAGTTTAGSCPALVYLPRDRYTTQVRLAMEEILLDAFGGTSIDYTALVSESVLARLHFVVRVDRRATRFPTSTRPTSRPSSCSPPAPGTTTSSTRCATAAASRRRSGWRNVYGDAFPEAYKEDFPAADAVADLHRLEALTNDGDIDARSSTRREARPTVCDG